MGGIARIIAFGALAIGLACAPSRDVTGHWKGERDLKANPGADPVVVGTLASIKLELKPSGEFDLFESGMPKSGRWATTGSVVELTVERIFDSKLKPGEMQTPLTLSVTADGKLSADFAGGAVLERSESQPGG